MATRLRQPSPSSVLHGLGGCVLAAALGGGTALSPVRLVGQADPTSRSWNQPVAEGAFRERLAAERAHPAASRRR
jgi:hypothetical protein